MQANAMSLRGMMWLGAALAALFAVMGLVFARPASAAFGIAAADQQITASAAGGAFTQAGGHPYAITTEINVNSHHDPNFYESLTPDAETKDIHVDVPPGLFGNPVGLPQCTEAQLVKAARLTGFGETECPVGSQVGIIQVRTNITELGLRTTDALFNMVPPDNAPARFGFVILGLPITITGNIRNGGDFGVTVSSEDIPISLPITGITQTFWGMPGDPSHDFQRCLGYLIEEEGHVAECAGIPGTEGGPHSFPEAVHNAFLTLPTSCPAAGVGDRTGVRVDSWEHPGVFVESEFFSHLAPGYPLSPSQWGPQQGFTNCQVVPFGPSMSVSPTNGQADTPTGLSVDFKLPQDGLLPPEGIATADVSKTVVTLPAGVGVSPSAGQGLGSCSLEQVGLRTGKPVACPDSSKLGTVEIQTPLLPTPLEGAIYLGTPDCGPCSVADDLAHRLIKLYVVAEGHGVILKLPGEVTLDPVTGQVVTTFDNSPQAPFTDLKVDFKGGPRSPLVNPPFCGSYTTVAQMTPWSGNPPVEAKSTFQITSGPEGKPCPSSPQAFGPSFAAGTTNNQAGAYSPMTVLFRRADAEQQLGGVTVTTPPGLLGSLAGVPLCPEPQASRGTCSAASEIGHITAGAGAGANPLYVYDGHVYLTGPYKGGPFGLSIVVPAVAGPFNLGIVVVRASIKLDPVTTALTVAADPLPTILDGIPLDLRVIDVSIDRPSFIVNPTNCDPMQLTGTLTGGLGSIEPVSSSFQVTNCGRLGFKPKFSVAATGMTSRANGAGLTARLTYPSGPQSNIAKVKVSLPKQLPSRLTTLQKGCSSQTFDTDPALCPAPSRIGTAVAVTPILPVPLSGPVYFVSHGGEAFPDLVIVLQGYGITFDLVGTTFISKTGITSTTFKTVPDVPVGSFELKLPQGPYSALAANGNLCTASLTMPTIFTAQDGTEIRQSTPITVTGCTQHRAHKASHRQHHKHKKRKKK